jgi:hypothetical protein
VIDFPAEDFLNDRIRTVSRLLWLSRLSEIARMLVRLDHVASFIVNANHSVVWAAVELRLVDCDFPRFPHSLKGRTPIRPALGEALESDEAAVLDLLSELRSALVLL